MELEIQYQQTSIGIFPNDWVIKKLIEIADIKSGGTPSTLMAEFWNGDIPWCTPTDITALNGNKYILSTNKKISHKGLLNSSAEILPINSILMTSRATIGECAINKTPMSTNQGFKNFIPREGINYEFLYYLLKIQKQGLTKLCSGSTFFEISKSILSNYQIALPLTKGEQSSIANALSDVDTWIQSLSRLIEKKHRIKQGAMQQLLKPKENWLEKRLGNVSTLKARIGWQGLTTSEYLKSGDYYLVTGTDFKNGYIDWENCHFVDELRYKQDKNIQLKANDVLVTKDGTIGKIALVPSLNKPATLNSGVFVIRPLNKTFDPIFFYYLLSSYFFIGFLNQLSAGSTINHLYQKDFVNFVFKTPPTLDEQVEIGRILFDMDIEISTLEKKLIKAQHIKQGMMQNLLTGRIRLI